MEPEKEARLRKIDFNGRMMDGELSTLPERVVAQLAAIEEVREGILSQQEEDLLLPPDFEPALQYAVRYLYRTGNPDGGEDLSRHLDNDLGYQRHKVNEGDWLPDNEEKMKLVHSIATVGSRLAIKDKTPSFQPNRESDRQFEIMDPYDVWYNKYGFLLPGTQTHGSYQ